MRSSRFPIVAIGASAGGVEALTALFRGLPPRPHAAFVVITHLAPHRESLLADILMRHTAMPVTEARHDQAIEEGHVYLIPPDAVMTVADEHLVLNERGGERNPVDIFLTSFALAVGDRAVAVILSGSGTDGAIGVKAVREAEGFTLAQGGGGTEPGHHGMPDAAIATGFVDCILPIDALAERIAAYIDSFEKPPLGARGDGGKATDEIEEAKSALCAILRERVGHDFSRYKPNTFLRRVERRMQVRRIADLRGYVAFVKDDPEEATFLFRDLLIGVTSFFRDPEAFDCLARLVIPELFAGKGADDWVRVWIPGCATGEEVYSVAILLREHMRTMGVHPHVQVFATDVDENALAVARAGHYPAKLLERMSPDRLERYFVREGRSFTIAKEVREICLFSCHSIVRDPPFLNLDLISCRNLLIYFKTELQNQVLPLFHYALRPGGFLFLGISEHVSQNADLFAPLDKKHRIFRRRDQPRRPAVFPVVAQTLTGRRAAQPQAKPVEGGTEVVRQAEALMLDRFAPAYVIVDDDWNLVRYSARTGKYLEPPAGVPTRNLLALARRGLQLALRSAMHEVVKTGSATRREGVRVECESGVQVIDLTIEPLPGKAGDHFWLTVFADVGAVRGRDEGVVADWPADQEQAFRQIEQELHQTRERLQISTEEYETAVEELKSANEELLSLNEELQSTNEELETSKEELQSVNEELHTVNVELSAKIDELDRANSDLKNLFASTRIATILLDRNLIIRSFTPAASDIFRLIPTDCGRPLADIATFLDYAGLPEDLRSVLSSMNAIERQIASRDGGAHYLMRLLPYWNSDRRIDGVIVTFIDVTDMIHVGQQKALVAELNHRVKNVLAVVTSMAAQLARRSTSVEEFNEGFLSRIRGLAQTHDILARHEWSDVAVDELFAAELSAFVGESSRAALVGPKVHLRPRATTTLGMVIHELATNAVKYGALSDDNGRVSVAWALRLDAEPPMLEITWREIGGPPVKTPERKGFGTELIERSLDFELGGTARIDYAREGLVVTLAIPAIHAVHTEGGTNEQIHEPQESARH